MCSGVRGEVTDLTVQKPDSSWLYFAGHFKLTGSLLYVRVNHFRVRLDTGKITRGEVSRRQRRSFNAYPTT
jgi:hypothetical protein